MTNTPDARSLLVGGLSDEESGRPVRHEPMTRDLRDLLLNGIRSRTGDSVAVD